MKKSIYFIISTLTLLTLSTACTNNTPSAQESTAPVETDYDDNFKVQVDTSKLGISDSSDNNSDTDTNAQDSTSDQDTTLETEDNRSIAEIEESVAESQREEIELEESKEYEAYLNSDEEYEIYLTFDKEDADYMYFSFDGDAENQEVYKVKKSNILGTVEDSLSHGEVALVLYNGAVIDDNELVKVYSIKNQTKIEQAEEESLFAEEAKELGISVEELKKIYEEDAEEEAALAAEEEANEHEG